MVVEASLEHTTVKGFPIIADDGNRTLMGYIGSYEIRLVLGPLNCSILEDLPPSDISYYRTCTEI